MAPSLGINKPNSLENIFGEIPEDWGSRKFSHEIDIEGGLVDPTDEQYASMPLIAPNHIESETGRLRSLETAKEQGAKSGKYLCEQGEVIYSKIRPELAKATIAPVDCLCSADMYPIDGNPRYKNKYLFWLLLSTPFTRWVKLESQRVAMPKVNRETLGRMEFPAPPLPIQKTIIQFLDDETSSIDDAIDKKEELRDLLHEKRLSIVFSAVTGGISDATSTKISRAGWIDEIPNHWDVVRTRFVARLESGHTPSRSNDEYWEDCNIPWVTTSDIKPFRKGRKIYLDETEHEISQLGLDNSGARLLPEGTVFLSRTASVGFSGIMGQEMATSQDFANWVCSDEIIPEYLLYIFRSMGQEFDRLTQGSTHQTIYMPDIKSFKSPLPPLEEQREIVDHIQTETERLWELIEKVEQTIDLLEEKRQALITAAVTGQIDVTEAQGIEEEPTP